METCDCHKTKERTEEEYKRLINRLNRVEGQIRGIRGMVERSAYCPDILAQVAAANAALNAFAKELLSDHIRTCVTRDIREGKDETVEELLCTLLASVELHTFYGCEFRSHSFAFFNSYNSVFSDNFHCVCYKCSNFFIACGNGSDLLYSELVFYGL